jgi:hypothetical protein
MCGLVVASVAAAFRGGRREGRGEDGRGGARVREERNMVEGGVIGGMFGKASAWYARISTRKYGDES